MKRYRPLRMSLDLPPLSPEKDAQVLRCCYKSGRRFVRRLEAYQAHPTPRGNDLFEEAKAMDSKLQTEGLNRLRFVKIQWKYIFPED